MKTYTQAELRIIDRLVAESFFGESRPEHPGNDWCHYRSAPLFSPRKRWMMTTDCPEHNGTTVWGGWMPMHYSTHIETAWKIAEHRDWCNGINRGNRGHGPEWNCGVIVDGRIVYVWGATAPIAICLAALAAVGVDVSAEIAKVGA